MRVILSAVLFGLVGCECSGAQNADGGAPPGDAGTDGGAQAPLDAGVDAGHLGDCGSDCDCRQFGHSGCINGRCTPVGRLSLCPGGVLVDAGLDAGPCSAATCPYGCCDSSGACQPGFTARSCGTNGTQCADCADDGGLGWCARSQQCGTSCFAQPAGAWAELNGGWQTGECPDAGCPAGTFCLLGYGESGNTYGCAPIAASCAGQIPTCACMGCICALSCYGFDGGITCDNGTISRREFKDDIRYLSEWDREALARQALQIPLARYRYKDEPEGARRRLGFLIDDQPNPSPAVMEDRLHVDEYGYTSMLLVTVQQQAREIAELQKRLDAIERRCR